MDFKALGISKNLLISLADEGIQTPTPIQSMIIPSIIENKDVLGIAPTGSGKTAAYALPILTRLEFSPAPRNRHPRVLILLPTRELTEQVFDVFKNLSWAIERRIKIKAVAGGSSINPQMMDMNNVEVLIATPGRLIELMEKKAVHLDELNAFVVDEADKLLNKDFAEEFDKINGALPVIKQSMLFSATLSPKVEGLQQLMLNDPFVAKIDPPKEEEKLIDQQAYAVTPERKGPLLRYLIKEKNWQQVLVFTSSKVAADKLVQKLTQNGIDAKAVHSKKSQHARTSALKEFKAKQLRVLVATDLLARGIDIEFLPIVVNYELPRSPKDYVHRIGRTGRAQNPGSAISLITPDEDHHFRVIQKKMKTRTPLENSDDLNLKGY